MPCEDNRRSTRAYLLMSWRYTIFGVIAKCHAKRHKAISEYEVMQNYIAPSLGASGDCPVPAEWACPALFANGTRQIKNLEYHKHYVSNLLGAMRRWCLNRGFQLI